MPNKGETVLEAGWAEVTMTQKGKTAKGVHGGSTNIGTWGLHNFRFMVAAQLYEHLKEKYI